MPWLAIPFSHARRRAALFAHFELDPESNQLVLLDSTGATIHRDGATLLQLAAQWERFAHGDGKGLVAFKGVDFPGNDLKTLPCQTLREARALASKEIGCDPDRSAAFNAAEGTLSIKTGATANHPDRGGRGERSGGVTMLYLGGDDQAMRKARELARSAWTPPHLLACCVPGRPTESAA
jgi:hypothetical protein